VTLLLNRYFPGLIDEDTEAQQQNEPPKEPFKRRLLIFAGHFALLSAYVAILTTILSDIVPSILIIISGVLFYAFLMFCAWRYGAPPTSLIARWRRHKDQKPLSTRETNSLDDEDEDDNEREMLGRDVVIMTIPKRKLTVVNI